MPWRITAARQTGGSHLRRGEECGDAFALDEFTLDDGGSALVLAVADGAGSARCGGHGAGIAARRAVEIARDLLTARPPADDDAAAGLLREVFRETLLDLLSRVDRWRVDGDGPVEDPRPQDFHTTLLLAILARGRLAAGNIGDGWLVARRDGAVGAVAPPAPGEYSNETFFLTSGGALDDAVVEVVPAADLDAVALLTDGTAWFAVDLAGRVPSGPLFAKLFAFAGDPSLPAGGRERDLTAFLASEAVARRSDDDKTLLLAVRGAG